MTIAQTLEWLRVYVLPTLWEEIGKKTTLIFKFTFKKEAHKPRILEEQLRMLAK